MRQDRPSLRRLAGIAVACSALLVVSCGGGEQSANAQETPSTPVGASEGADVVLVNLDDPGEVATWRTVNDPVMGGASTSKVTFGNGGLVFSGNISLENNGGFASARSPQDPGLGRLAAGATSLRVRGQGDGKNYVLEAGIEGQPWSYIQRFTTDAGVERTYDLPIAGFQPVGMRFDPAPDAPQALDPSLINQVSVFILDKQQGPFELTINGIAAARGSQS
ncbi:CIA30 family protein [Mycolicibacterium vaccae]|uniref:CIA30 family protein n=1 Tax=Mycolicibacterium vaccae TaxID=1810 RepID=UPI003D026F5B